MTALEQSEELRNQAISILLEERQAIDEQLKLLGNEDEKTHVKRRGRPKEGQGDPQLEACPAENFEEVESHFTFLPYGESIAHSSWIYIFFT